MRMIVNNAASQIMRSTSVHAIGGGNMLKCTWDAIQIREIVSEKKFTPGSARRARRILIDAQRLWRVGQWCPDGAAAAAGDGCPGARKERPGVGGVHRAPAGRRE